MANLGASLRSQLICLAILGVQQCAASQNCCNLFSQLLECSEEHAEMVQR